VPAERRRRPLAAWVGRIAEQRRLRLTLLWRFERAAREI
jgi:hypothetical protein